MNQLYQQGQLNDLHVKFVRAGRMAYGQIICSRGRDQLSYCLVRPDDDETAQIMLVPDEIELIKFTDQL